MDSYKKRNLPDRRKSTLDSVTDRNHRKKNQMMPRLVLEKSFRVTGVTGCNHVSHISSDRVWISDDKGHLVLSNAAGEELHRVTDITTFDGGVHTVTSDGDLIYIDRNGNINKLSKDNKVKTVLIPYNTLIPYNRFTWGPQCVYSSPSTGDLLVGEMYVDYTMKGQVNRYTNTGQHIQTMQHDNTGQRLCIKPIYITENCNGDVIVSDYYRGVVVTDRGGRHRFTYRGPTSGSGLAPRGICTDALSHILVCDLTTLSVQILDSYQRLLSQADTQQHGIDVPWSMSYDERTQLLLVGSRINSTVNIYRLVYGDSLTYLSIETL
ncbi:uncharacterized protein LOC134245335 [Saccostrea cucullata]|uniref:uncharacterized protein LOC134245335 n=1 Tax=Saccostrea cuccullata TaxID=36930 RepID=UPI002ED3CC90